MGAFMHLLWTRRDQINFYLPPRTAFVLGLKGGFNATYSSAKLLFADGIKLLPDV